jgi:hypothetical protein
MPKRQPKANFVQKNRAQGIFFRPASFFRNWNHVFGDFPMLDRIGKMSPVKIQQVRLDVQLRVGGADGGTMADVDGGPMPRAPICASAA